MIHVILKLYFLVPQFQFASHMVFKFCKKTELVPLLVFPSKN
jgi:hypothetical protein